MNAARGAARWLVVNHETMAALAVTWFTAFAYLAWR